jgi:hypothetical protein
LASSNRFFSILFCLDWPLPAIILNGSRGCGAQTVRTVKCGTRRTAAGNETAAADGQSVGA